MNILMIKEKLRILKKSEKELGSKISSGVNEAKISYLPHYK
jgi:hypothetical protein